jgi:hypothetical protein
MSITYWPTAADTVLGTAFIASIPMGSKFSTTKSMETWEREEGIAGDSMLTGTA